MTHAGGRPLKYRTVNELKLIGDKYFENVPDNQWTVTGLAYYLGFTDRNSLIEYTGRPEFTYTLKRYKLRIEASYELQSRQTSSAGAIFALKNFGWRDNYDVTSNGEKVEAMQLYLPTKLDEQSIDSASIKQLDSGSKQQQD